MANLITSRPEDDQRQAEMAAAVQQETKARDAENQEAVMFVVNNFPTMAAIYAQDPKGAQIITNNFDRLGPTPRAPGGRTLKLNASIAAYGEQKLMRAIHKQGTMTQVARDTVKALSDPVTGNLDYGRLEGFTEENFQRLDDSILGMQRLRAGLMQPSEDADSIVYEYRSAREVFDEYQLTENLLLKPIREGKTPASMEAFTKFAWQQRQGYNRTLGRRDPARQTETREQFLERFGLSSEILQATSISGQLKDADAQLVRATTLDKMVKSASDEMDQIRIDGLTGVVVSEKVSEARAKLVNRKRELAKSTVTGAGSPVVEIASIDRNIQGLANVEASIRFHTDELSELADPGKAGGASPEAPTRFGAATSELASVTVKALKNVWDWSTAPLEGTMGSRILGAGRGAPTSADRYSAQSEQAFIEIVGLLNIPRHIRTGSERVDPGPSFVYSGDVISVGKALVFGDSKKQAAAARWIAKEYDVEGIIAHKAKIVETKKKRETLGARVKSAAEFLESAKKHHTEATKLHDDFFTKHGKAVESYRRGRSYNEIKQETDRIRRSTSSSSVKLPAGGRLDKDQERYFKLSMTHADKVQQQVTANRRLALDQNRFRFTQQKERANFLQRERGQRASIILKIRALEQKKEREGSLTRAEEEAYQKAVDAYYKEYPPTKLPQLPVSQAQRPIPQAQ